MTFSLGSVDAAWCDRVADDAFAFLDGELAPSAAADVTIHLARCPRCRALVARDERSLARVRRAARLDEAPPPLRARVAALLAAWSAPLAERP